MKKTFSSQNHKSGQTKLEALCTSGFIVNTLMISNNQ